MERGLSNRSATVLNPPQDKWNTKKEKKRAVDTMDFPQGDGANTLSAEVVFMPMETSGRRIFWSVTNMSTSGEIVFLSFGSIARLNYGQPLFPGQTYLESIGERFDPYNGDVHAIGTAATAVISWTKRVEPATVKK